MAKKKAVKPLNKMQTLFIEQNAGVLPPEEIAQETGGDEGVVRALVEEILAERESRPRFDVHESGAVCMTAAQSMADDDVKRESQEDYLARNAGHIHRIEPKRRR